MNALPLCIDLTKEEATQYRRKHTQWTQGKPMDGWAHARKLFAQRGHSLPDAGSLTLTGNRLLAEPLQPLK